MKSKDITQGEGKIEIRRWDVLDIFYMEADEKEVNVIISDYIARGWDDEQYGPGSNKEYEMSVQLTKIHKIKTKKLNSK